MKRLLVMVAAVALLSAQGAFAQVVGFEDFDGGSLNLSSTTNVFDFGAGGGAVGDVFGRVSPFAGGAGTGGPFDTWDDSVTNMSGGGVFAGDLRAVAGQNSSAFFALNDMDGSSIPPGDGSLNNATWSFDISSAVVGIANIQIDIAALGDFEASSTDGFRIEAQIDGGGYSEIFKGRTDEAAFKSYRPMDDGGVFSDDDPLELSIDGVTTGIYLDKSDPITGDFDTYVSTLFAGQSGTTLDIRASWAGTPSGSEPMGIDNITINVPEPATLALLAFGAVAGLRRRK